MGVKYRCLLSKNEGVLPWTLYGHFCSGLVMRTMNLGAHFHSPLFYGIANVQKLRTWRDLREVILESSKTVTRSITSDKKWKALYSLLAGKWLTLQMTLTREKAKQTYKREFWTTGANCDVSRRHGKIVHTRLLETVAIWGAEHGVPWRVTASFHFFGIVVFKFVPVQVRQYIWLIWNCKPEVWKLFSNNCEKQKWFVLFVKTCIEAF